MRRLEPTRWPCYDGREGPPITITINLTRLPPGRVAAPILGDCSAIGIGLAFDGRDRRGDIRVAHSAAREPSKPGVTIRVAFDTNVIAPALLPRFGPPAVLFPLPNAELPK